MKKADFQLLSMRNFFDWLGLPFCLHGGSLLRIVRDGELGDTCGSSISCQLEDITEKVMEKLEKSDIRVIDGMTHQPKKEIKNRDGQWLWFYDYESRPTRQYYNEYPHYPIKVKVMEMWPMKTMDNKVFMSMGDTAWWWPKSAYQPWQKIKYLGLEWNAPNDLDEWFERRHGKDWRTPKEEYHSKRNACLLSEIGRR